MNKRIDTEDLKNVAFILHPINIDEFKKKAFFYAPFEVLVAWLLNQFSPKVVKNFFSKLPPHSFMSIHNLKSPSNLMIDVQGIMCGLFPEEVVVNKEAALKKVLDAINYAVRKDAQVVVLAGFTSIVCSNEQCIESIVRDTNIIITSGNTFTAALAIDGILKSAELLQINPSKSTLAVIGATGDIGSICAKVLSKRFRNVILCSRNIQNDDLIVKETSVFANKVIIENNFSDAVKNSEVILLATSSFISFISSADVKPYSIICDVSLPHNVDHDFLEKRRDVFVFDGGRSMINCDSQDKKWANFVKNNSIYGCIAEGLILGFEKEYKKFSINRGDITEDNICKILSLGEKNGFGLADFSFHEIPYKQEDLKMYRDLFISRHC